VIQEKNDFVKVFKNLGRWMISDNIILLNHQNNYRIIILNIQAGY